MPVVGVREVGVGMLHGFMAVPVGMLLAGGQDKSRLIRVTVLMVLVVLMFMFMLVVHRLVNMAMLVPLREVQPDAQAHQQSSGNHSHGDRLATDQSQCSPEERGH